MDEVSNIYQPNDHSYYNECNSYCPLFWKVIPSFHFPHFVLENCIFFFPPSYMTWSTLASIFSSDTWPHNSYLIHKMYMDVHTTNFVLHDHCYHNQRKNWNTYACHTFYVCPLCKSHEDKLSSLMLWDVHFPLEMHCNLSWCFSQIW